MITAIADGGTGAGNAPDARDNLFAGSFYIPDQVNFMGSIFVGDGGRNLVHTTGLEGQVNTGVGFRNLTSATTAEYNTAVGFEGLYLTTTGSFNTAVGEGSMCYNITGNHNTAVGCKSFLNKNGIGTGDYNAFFGAYAGLQSAGGNRNTGIGTYSLTADSLSGFNNTALGYYSGGTLTTGSGNVLIGYYAGDYLTTGSNNTVVGSFNLAADAHNTVIIAAGDKARFVADQWSVRTYSADNSRQTFDIEDSGEAIFFGPARLKSFTVATLPAAGAPGSMIFVSDAAGGCVPAFSDGSCWRRFTDRAVVS